MKFTYFARRGHLKRPGDQVTGAATKTQRLRVQKQWLCGSLLTVSLIGISSAGAVPGVPLTGNFESGNFSGWKLELNSNRGSNFGPGSIVKSPVRSGKYAAKFDLQRGGTKKVRAEVRVSSQGIQYEKDYWYGWSTYLPAGWQQDKYRDVIAQYHGEADNKSVEIKRSPPLEFFLKGSQLHIATRWDAKKISEPGVPNYKALYTKPYADMIGKWTDFVVHLKWSWKNTGILEIWKNGKKIVSYKGPNAFNDAIAPYFKIGIYKPDWRHSDRHNSVPRRVIYHDEVRIRGAGAGYADVAPGGKPVSAPTNQPPKINKPPKVNAGVDKTPTLRIPATVNLNGSASDDGMPNGQLKTVWRKVSGPGTVTFSKVSNPSTSATFTRAGKYVLRLSANDGKTSASDTMNVEVRPVPAPKNNTVSKPKPVQTVNKLPKQPVPVKRQPRPNRVTNGIVAYYDFEEGRGSIIKDVSKVGKPLNLKILGRSATSWVPGGLVIDKPTRVISSKSASKLATAVRSSREITVETWIAPDNKNQKGPARIISLSSNATNSNLTLGQNLSKYQVRLRTTSTGNNGTRPFLETSSNNVFPQLSHVVYTRNKSGVAKLYINGQPKVSKFIAGKPSNWNKGYRLVLANERTGGHAWLGEYQMMAFYKRALSLDEIKRNFKAGPTDK